MSLPPQTTSFLGRAAELAELARLLARAEVRLLTIYGPGGMGKTRLALAAAAQAAQRFAAGAAFVPLQAVAVIERVPTAIAEALALPLAGTADPFDQVAGFLHDRQQLLVLDNLEHLPAAGALISRLLAAAPGLTLLATSREALHLQEEWLFPLAGLALPNDHESSDAVRLFFERARQARYDLELATEYAAIVQICRLVGGMPLAIELAAAWTRTLSCAAIAAALAQSLDLLSSNLRNIPERHRSLRAVCDQAWALLGPGEQQAFQQLALFEAGFSAPAAQAVAGADLSLLDALISRSLVRRSDGDRYQIHALLRQYGVERLYADRDAAERTRAALGRYYSAFLNDWFDRVEPRGITVEALAALTPELANLRAVWSAVLAQSEGETLRRAANLVQNYYFVRGPYREGAELIRAALEYARTLPPTPERIGAQADMLLSLGWFELRSGRLAEARALFLECAACAPDQPRPSGDITEPLTGLGLLALIEGDYREAVRLGLAALERAESEDHRSNQGTALYVLVSAALAQGQYTIAARYAERMTALIEQIGNTWFLAYCEIDRGHIAGGQGDYAAARRHYQAAYRLREPFGDPQGMAVALTSEGGAALLAGAPQEAHDLFERSLAIYRHLGDQGGLAETLHGYARALLTLERFAPARAALQEALALADALGATPLQLAVLVTIAEALLHVGRAERGAQLISLVARHPAADRATSRRAHDALISLDGAPAPAQLDPAALPAILVAAQDDLAALDVTTKPTAERSAPNDALVEPLTEREQDILARIAEGHSNQTIAEALICSVGTVKWYTTQIYGKLGVKSRTQAVARARELGLL